MEKNFLAEFIDGGPECIRDDCDVSVLTDHMKIKTLDSDFINVRNKYCKTCGKSWSEQQRSKQIF